MESKKKCVLIADDDIDYLFQLRLNIEKMGFDVIAAESQREAEKIIEKYRPDLAIFDLMMENEDSGFILSYKMKRQYPDVPIIIATSVTAETGINFEDGDDTAAGWIKADLFLEKGMRADQLQREINKLLKI